MSEIFQNTIPVVDIAFVGNLPNKEDLAGAALITVWFNLWNAAMLGFFNSAILDTFLAQTYGANELKGYAMWTGTGLVIVMIVTCFVAGLVALCGPVMKLFGQDEDLAERAGQFSYRLIPGLFPYYASKVLVKYLQSQDIVMPGVWTGFLANGIKILFSWLLIYYNLDLGLNGAPWSTSITRFAEFFVICGYMAWYRHSEKLQSTWPTIDREMWNMQTLSPFCKLALSGALSFSAGAWSFEIATILTGLVGTVQLDVHIITLSIATFLFFQPVFPLPLESPLPEEEVSALVSCVFMLGDSLQATIGGIMPGLGHSDWYFS